MIEVTIRLYADYGPGEVLTWDGKTDADAVSIAAGDLTDGGEDGMGQPEFVYLVEFEGSRAVNIKDAHDALYHECQAFMAQYQKDAELDAQHERTERRHLMAI